MLRPPRGQRTLLSIAIFFSASDFSQAGSSESAIEKAMQMSAAVVRWNDAAGNGDGLERRVAPEQQQHLAIRDAEDNRSARRRPVF